MNTDTTAPAATADFEAQFAAIMQNVETAGTVLMYGLLAIMLFGVAMVFLKASARAKAPVRR